MAPVLVLAQGLRNHFESPEWWVSAESPTSRLPARAKDISLRELMVAHLRAWSGRLSEVGRSGPPEKSHSFILVARSCRRKGLGCLAHRNAEAMAMPHLFRIRQTLRNTLQVQAVQAAKLFRKAYKAVCVPLAGPCTPRRSLSTRIPLGNCSAPLPSPNASKVCGEVFQ